MFGKKTFGKKKETSEQTKQNEASLNAAAADNADQAGSVKDSEAVTSNESSGKPKKQRKNIADFIVDNSKAIAVGVLGLVIVCLCMSPFVGVNYDMTQYLPDFAPSKIAIDKMEETFGYPGTGRLMLKDVTIYEAKDYKDKVEKVDGVDQVIWCDLTTSMTEASDFIDYESIDDYYKDGCAVMDVTFEEGDSSKLTHQAIDDIEDIIGDKGYIVGMSPTNKFTEENVEKEMTMILTIAVVMIFIILMLTTTSYFEPILFLTVIGVAIFINKGTNLVLGSISYITNNIAAVIQLATSMDYSIFLLSSYEREREKGLDKVTALKAGLMTTIKTVLSSSLTTFFGFLVLVLMRFKIGWDMGIVMSKSIICSLLMVIFFMPALLLMWSDLIDKTRHKPLLPKFDVFAKVVNKLSPIVLIAVMVLAVPMYFTQSMNNFMYGPDAMGVGEKTAIYHETQEIDDMFGRSNLLVAIFPNEGNVKERELVDDLKDRDYVKSVMGMTAYLPEGAYEDILPSSLTEMFHKDGYTRLLIYIRTKPESKAAYQYYEEVQKTIQSYYGADNTYIAGNTPTTEDMENILKVDYTRVNNLSMISIFIVVAIAFKSVIIPIGAMIPIMAAIYLNMSFPYLMGTELVFIAYAVVSCIQLGSTIDYAILNIENYRQIRETEPDKNRAAIKTIQMSFPSMLTSGGILIVCGYIVYFVSTSPSICEVGHLVGRGAIFSVIFVTTLMPSILKIMDKFIVTDHRDRRAARKAKLKAHGARAVSMVSGKISDTSGSDDAENAQSGETENADGDDMPVHGVGTEEASDGRDQAGNEDLTKHAHDTKNEEIGTDNGAEDKEA